MTTTSQPTTDAQADLLHLSIERFYARQMQLLDNGSTDEWAATFTADGTFSAAFVQGRPAIAKAAARAHAARVDRGVQHRHWMGMLVPDPLTDGSVRAECYAVVYEISAGGQPTPHSSTLCQDVLVRAEGESWTVASRQVTKDGSPAAGVPGAPLHAGS